MLIVIHLIPVSPLLAGYGVGGSVAGVGGVGGGGLCGRGRAGLVCGGRGIGAAAHQRGGEPLTLHRRHGGLQALAGEGAAARPLDACTKRCK